MKERLTSGLWLILSGAAMILLGIYHSAFGKRGQPVELAPDTPSKRAELLFQRVVCPNASSRVFCSSVGLERGAARKLRTPTYTPVMMAFGIIFIALGLVTKWYVAMVGGTVFAISVWRWIGEIRND